MEVFLAVLLVSLQLIVGLLGVQKAYLELKSSRKEGDDRSEARHDDRRPKHLKG